MNKKIYILISVLAVIILGGYFITRNSPEGIEQTKRNEIVELKNGDSYDLVMGSVEKEINGKTYRMLAYNGSIPGPLIKVPQGAEITLNLKNNTDIETSLHSHGVRMDNRFDGAAPVTQDVIKPGESFTYKIKFPDVGMYWYHPHVKDYYAQELGLYGNYLVIPTNKDYWSPVNREIPLFLDDILIKNGIIGVSKEKADQTLVGRFGNVMLVNGETDYRVSINKGDVVRFYLTNAANTRPFNFSIAGLKLKVVGADGGAYERDEWHDSVLLGPSERVIVEVLFDKSGTFAMEHKTPGKTYQLGSITVADLSSDISYVKEFTELKMHDEVIQSIDLLRSYFDKALDKRLAFTVDMMGMQGMGQGGRMMSGGQMMGGSMMGASPDGIDWEGAGQMMNQMSNIHSVRWKIIDQDTGKENMNIAWTFKQGQPVKIRLSNDPNSMHPMQHPIHFHGQRFLILARNGAKETNLVWKDTVFVRAGETVDILLDASNLGTWMAHCHILEHIEAGMMFIYKVEN